MGLRVGYGRRLGVILLVVLSVPLGAAQAESEAVEHRTVQRLYFHEASVSTGPVYALCGPTYGAHELSSRIPTEDDEARITVPASQFWLGCDLRFVHRAGGSFVIDGVLSAAFAIECDGPAVTAFDPYVRIYREEYEVVASTSVTGGPGACLPGQRLEFNVSVAVEDVAYSPNQALTVAIDPQATSDSATGAAGAFFLVEAGPKAGHVAFDPPLNVTVPARQDPAPNGARPDGQEARPGGLLGLSSPPDGPGLVWIALGAGFLLTAALVVWGLRARARRSDWRDAMRSMARG